MRLFLSMALVCAAPLVAADAKWIRLFDGKSLKGWTVCNGQAAYKVEKGVIVGTTAEGSPNSFLCSDKEYGDFVLEFESLNDPELNSGVQIRSHRYEADTKVRTFDGKKTGEHTQKAGRFYGYQVEISTAGAGVSGGVYDEARRGWLQNEFKDPACKTAFKDKEWNKYRIEAHGDRIRTSVNGVPCVDLIDSADLSGYIGLQVHSYEGSKPAQVRWRNIRIQDNGRHVWKPVWGGNSMDGWPQRGGGKWVVEDGAIHAKSVEGDTRVGYLVSDMATKDETIRVRYKIASGNSGFFFKMDPDMKAGYEVEIDAQKRSGGFWEVGRRNWVTGPEDNALQVDGWNEATASVRDGRLVFHLNGIKTVDIPDPEPVSKEGRMALQCHGRMPTEVWFKDIAILVPEKR